MCQSRAGECSRQTRATAQHYAFYKATVIKVSQKVLQAMEIHDAGKL